MFCFMNFKWAFKDGKGHLDEIIEEISMIISCIMMTIAKLRTWSCFKLPEQKKMNLYNMCVKLIWNEPCKYLWFGDETNVRIGP